MHIYHNARSVVRALAPEEPITLIRPHAAERAARFFVEKFPGKALYAVKANPSPALLRTLWRSGITHYDVASIAEVRTVRATLPEAELCFMHPVKAERAIAEAYFDHGVRSFSVDTSDELESLRIDFWERKLIKQALERTGGNVPEAARLLGIGRATLYRKVDEYGLK